MIQKRNISIDILKFIAAILITNSHMDALYGQFSFLSTGGALGDVLFFFCSGFTLFSGRNARFDNWYKRRINRIYPTIFAWAIITTLFFNNHQDIIHIILYGGGWFVSCIMIYYIILYIIRHLLYNKLKLVFIVSSLIIIFWYFLMERPSDFNMYGNTYFKWGHYFLFMLLGAIIGSSKIKFYYNIIKDSALLIISLIVYYSILIISNKYYFLHDIQILSLIPLLFVTIYFYKCCNTKECSKLYNNKYTGSIIKFIGGLCLEIYIVQIYLLKLNLNIIFPINIFIMFILIIVIAYILRCFARVLSQTFKENDYDWRTIFKPL